MHRNCLWEKLTDSLDSRASSTHSNNMVMASCLIENRKEIPIFNVRVLLLRFMMTLESNGLLTAITMRRLQLPSLVAFLLELLLVVATQQTSDVSRIVQLSFHPCHHCVLMHIRNVMLVTLPMPFPIVEPCYAPSRSHIAQTEMSAGKTEGSVTCLRILEPRRILCHYLLNLARFRSAVTYTEPLAWVNIWMS